ncbi:hypothetical protein PVK06_020553 [Gossypium arboreum]|uniref:Uncharacterized protein n=1 Tax=Gossypium arboreum TaxID=29729 RepID=A0ABR0PMP0_GOSAR|nr:hypothetical protein PVK06_020553 [Gossypium arboreum]
MPSQENARPIEEHLRVVPFELEIIKQDFDKRSRELGKKIEKLEEEKMQLVLDVEIHKLKAEKLRKGKNKSQNEKERLIVRVEELEKSLHQHHNRNSMVELRASLNKIEELKGMIEELETALRNGELQVEILEASNERWKEKLHRSQD